MRSDENDKYGQSTDERRKDPEQLQLQEQADGQL
jgi:hypothetical protein